MRALARRATLLAVLTFGAVLAMPARSLAQQPEVRVVDAGPGEAGRRLADVLAGPHQLIGPTGSTVRLARGQTIEGPLVILAPRAEVASRVRGDVIVVGGDLFLHPGVDIAGRAVAIGGGVYSTSLGRVSGGERSYRDFTYDVVPAPGGYELHYRSLVVAYAPAITWPGIFGLRIPTYDRVDGLSLPFGPAIAVGDALEVEPTVTYRSQLGAFDPDVAAHLQLGRRTFVEGVVGRTTPTNDAWIASDVANSLYAFGIGRDVRNYYRADRAEATLHRLWEWRTREWEPFVGARIERAHSVGYDSVVTSAPFSIFGRHSDDGMRRPNPRVNDGDITSLLGGARLAWSEGGVDASASARAEAALTSPTARFVQTTLDGTVAFPTFGTQRFRFETHVVLSAAGARGGVAPRQRWAYLGGAGTVPTLELLSEGGDQLFFVESRYEIPLDRIQLPIVGAPELMFRHIAGGAAAGHFPTLTQNLGVRVSAGPLRLDLLIDPATRTTVLRPGISLTR